MSKLSSMTIGLVLIFIGLQLMWVKSYTLSPTGTRFMQQELQTESSQANNGGGLFTGIFRPSGQTNNSAPQAGQSWPYYRSSNASAANAGVPVYQASTTQASNQWVGQTKKLAPPRWLAWPPLFLGVVLFLHGLALRQ